MEVIIFKIHLTKIQILQKLTLFYQKLYQRDPN